MDEPLMVEFVAFSNFVEAIDETRGEVVAAFFLTTSWQDNRLKPMHEIMESLAGFQHDTLPFPSQMKDELWMPDLYLPMARRVAVPTVHQPAESITIKPNNTIHYTAYFVITFKCQMTYRNYPMDQQSCDLDVMSYTRNNKRMRLRWGDYGLQGELDLNTKHFHVCIIRQDGVGQLTQPDPNGKKDVLRIRFHLRRHLTFHLLQTYMPSVLLVVVGWLSLLVPLDFAYGRMVLSVTTLLVLVSIFVTTSQTSPGVNEVKALDIWLFMCIFFVFSAIVDCIVDLRFLSMVEKESQMAGEAEQQAGAPPIVDEKLRASLTQRPSAPDTNPLQHSFSVVFHGTNTPFQADKEALIATPAVLKWLRMAVYLERGMTVIYPTLFVLFMAVYWAVFLSSHVNRPH